MNESRTRKADPAGIVVAVLLALVAAIIAWDASRLELGQTYGLGPKAMPYVIYLTFAKVLTLSLPAGPLERLL